MCVYIYIYIYIYRDVMINSKPDEIRLKRDDSNRLRC